MSNKNFTVVALVLIAFIILGSIFFYTERAKRAIAYRTTEAMTNISAPPSTVFSSWGDLADCAYPETSEFLEQCLEYRIDTGTIKEEEADVLRETKGVGPGGCVGESCIAFCNNPVNEGVCFEFAKEHNLFSPEEKAWIEAGVTKLKEELLQAPPALTDCLAKTADPDELEHFFNGTNPPPYKLKSDILFCLDAPEVNTSGENGVPEHEASAFIPMSFSGFFFEILGLR